MQPSRSPRGINHIDNADRNRRVLLAAIRESIGGSRTELARATGLSPATTKRLVDDLISQGLVDEVEVAEEREGRGRRPSGLSLGRRGGFAVGLALGPGSLEVLGLALDGERIYRKHLAPDTEASEGFLALLVSEARAAIATCSGMGKGGLLGLGAGVTGLVDARAGRVLWSPVLPEWQNVELALHLGEALSAKVVVDDVVRCMALAEKRYGSAQGLETFLYVYIGAGIGSGLVLDNRIYRGRNGVSGEFGHLIVREDGPACGCGNRGCLEAVASTEAILARASAEYAPAAGPATLATLGEAATRGDPVALRIVAEAGESIGIGVAGLINIFDPGTLILAGEVVEGLGEPVLEGVREAARRRSLHSIAQRTEVRKGAFPADTAALGAATMVIERFLETGILNL